MRPLCEQRPESLPQVSSLNCTRLPTSAYNPRNGSRSSTHNSTINARAILNWPRTRDGKDGLTRIGELRCFGTTFLCFPYFLNGPGPYSGAVLFGLRSRPLTDIVRLLSGGTGAILVNLKGSRRET